MYVTAEHGAGSKRERLTLTTEHTGLGQHQARSIAVGQLGKAGREILSDIQVHRDSKGHDLSRQLEEDL
jgi:hypothetical protein